MEAPPAPPGMDALAAPPAPPGMEAPPAPPGMDALAAPPAPPGMEAPPAPPGMDPLAAPPAPPSMDPLGSDVLMPPAPPELEPLTEDTVAALEETTSIPVDDPLAMPAPPAPPGLEAPAEDPLAMPAPPAPPGLDPLSADALLAPPAPPEDPLAMPAPAAPSGLDPLAADALLAAPAPPADPLVDDALLSPAPPADLPDLTAALPVEGVQGEGEDKLDATEEGLSGVVAGAVLRSTDEVDSIAGDKLQGSIHEVEHTDIDADGHVTKQKVTGTLTLTNPSEGDRVYDVDAVMSDAASTNLEGHVVSVEELEPGQEHVVEYTVSDRNMLMMTERFDTNPARDKERSLSLAMGAENTIALEIDVRNVGASDLHDVVVSRPLPAGMSVTEAEHASVEDGALSWDVGMLATGASSTLVVRGTLTTDGKEPISSGSAVATYRADAALSTMNFEDLDAFCRGFAYMRSVEGERPDTWEVTAVFENRSSFAVDLVKLQARLKGSDELLFDFSDVNEDVAPHGEWRSESVSVASAEKPDLTWELSYTVLPRTSASTEGTLTMTARDLAVVDGKVEKTYSKAKLHSYREQTVQAEIKITNTGSSDINLMRLTDDIPGMFHAVDTSTLKIKHGGQSLPPEQFKAEVSEGITLEGEHHSPDGAGHTLTLTIGRKGPIGMAPGDVVVVTYDLVAPDPSPQNERVDAPIRSEFSCERFGPVCERDVEHAPSIRVVHNRRDFSAGKQALKVGGRGRYEVLILFENNGDTPLADVQLKDVIPPGYEMDGCDVRANKELLDDVEMTQESDATGTTVVWHLASVGKSERIDVSYMIKGEGEIDTDLLNTFHGAVFGDEIEDDDAPVEAPAAEEESEEETAEADHEDAAPAMKFRDDVLDRVMEAHGIDSAHRDAFIAHASSFDHDGNNYLKKQELEDAAAAWNEANADGSEDEAAEAEEPSDEDAQAESEGAAADSDESDGNDEVEASTKSCPICMKDVPSDATECDCGFVFDV
ncbi:MAG: hypothetical protein CMA56_03755 [Euryarchaeota archaeon]|nr:hypothetical protein [Euryarchaeota archaeon]